MNTYIFLYGGMALFEVVLASFFMKEKGNVCYIGEETDSVTSEEGFHLNIDMTLHEIDKNDIDVFILPGGPIEDISKQEQLKELIQYLDKEKKVIGGICAGMEFICDTLIIDKVEKTQTIKDNVILAPGNEYVDFAIELGKRLDIYEDENDLQETINYFRNFMA